MKDSYTAEVIINMLGQVKGGQKWSCCKLIKLIHNNNKSDYYSDYLERKG